MCNRLHTIPACDRRTDGQTDEQTSCHGIVRAMHTRCAVKSWRQFYSATSWCYCRHHGPVGSKIGLCLCMALNFIPIHVSLICIARQARSVVMTVKSISSLYTEYGTSISIVQSYIPRAFSSSSSSSSSCCGYLEWTEAYRRQCLWHSLARSEDALLRVDSARRRSLCCTWHTDSSWRTDQTHSHITHSTRVCLSVCLSSVPDSRITRNLAITNRSRVSSAQHVEDSTASI